MKEKDNTKKTLRFSPKKIFIIFICIILVISMAPLAFNFLTNKSSSSEKWITVGDRYTHSNVILGEYGAYIQQNYAYVQQNPYVLANFLNSLISNNATILLFAEEAEDLNISVSDDLIIRIMSTFAPFQDEEGNFSRGLFQETVNQSFGSERIFFDFMSNNILGEQITESLLPLIEQPSYLAYLDYLALTQERTVEYIEVDNNLIGDIPAPTEEDLLIVRDENPEVFTNEETRNGDVLVINKDTLTSNVTVSEEEAREYYENNIATFYQEELRNISQINFATEEEAKEAYKSLQNSTVEEAENNFTLVNIGEITYQGFPPELADEIFDASENKFIAPLETPLGWHIFVVTEVKDQEAADFSVVKEDITQQLLSSKQQSLIDLTRTNINDLIQSNTSLEEIAQQTSAEITSFENLTRVNMDYSREISDSIFGKTIDDTLVLEESQSNEFYVARVNEITHSRVLDVDEVRTELHLMWQEKQRAEKTALLIQEMKQKIDEGANIKELGYTTKTSTISLAEEIEVFEQNAVAEIFEAGKNKSISGNLSNLNPFVGVVKDINNPSMALKAEDGSYNEDVLGYLSYSTQSYAQGLMQVYSKRIEKNHKLYVDEKSIMNKLAPSE